MSYLPWGLYYSYDNRVVSLPLLDVHAVATVKELAAQVKLTHTYGNDADIPIEANYSFPIPARAAVCSFAMIRQDGTRIVGCVQEKREARETYQSALFQGKSTALMEQQSPDVFQLAVGNIQPMEQVKIVLVYATELSEDEENDSVRFHLPIHIGARYGQDPSASSNSRSYYNSLFFPSPSRSPFLAISVNVEAVAPISKIACMSHTVLTELGPDPAFPNAQQLSFSNYARVSLSSESPLDKDFVLTVKSSGLDAPRCVAELHPIHATAALTLTLVPRFKLPDLARQEFIFLVDRSGSMKGPRIEAAKTALVVMLRSLPAKDSFFQIASFGTACTALWEDGSQPYNQRTLEDATRHVDQMSADYGGTKIRGALSRCLLARKSDRPTALFLLTDGAAWDVDGVLSEVNAMVAGAASHAYVRVSVLGIGNSASTAMCEGIARVGNGTCMMVEEHETSFTGKIARMLKAARTPLISDVTVNWGVPVMEVPDIRDSAQDDGFVMVSGGEETKAPIDMFDEAVDPIRIDAEPVPPAPAVVLLPPPPVQQSPFKIRTINPGSRLNVYAILQGRTVPKSVTITGLAEDGTEVRLVVSVALSNLPNEPDSLAAIHALAARKIVQDLEDGQHSIASSIPDNADLLARTVMASIVRLGILYSISTSQTSFVAVDESYNSPYALPTVSTVVEAFSLHTKRPWQPDLQKNRERDRESAIDQWRSLSLMYRGKLASEERFAKSFSMSPNAIHTRHTQSMRSKKLRRVADSLRMTTHDPQQTMRPSLMATLANSPTNVAEESWVAPESWSAEATRPDLFTDTACSKETQYLRRKCFNCQTSETPSWRRSASDPSKVVCNKCGLYERTMLRPRLLRCPDGKQGLTEGSDPSTLIAPMDPLEALARLQSFDGCFSPAVLSTVQLVVDAEQARAALLDGMSDEIFATLVAMAFLSTKLGPDIEWDSWGPMYEKARAFVEDALQNHGALVGVDELQAMAISMLA